MRYDHDECGAGRARTRRLKTSSQTTPNKGPKSNGIKTGIQRMNLN